jgi:hypothetical protein
VLAFSNGEDAPVKVAFVGGALSTLGLGPEGPSKVIRNLTITRYNAEIPPGEKESLTYSFSTELHPQDLRLSLSAVLSDSKGAFYTVQAFNETVGIVEAPTSIFDPQM